MTTKDLDEALTTIAAKAKALRDAGVIGRVTIGEISFDLSDATPSAVTLSRDGVESDPIDDGATFGAERVPQPKWAARPRDDEDKE